MIRKLLLIAAAISISAATHGAWSAEKVRTTHALSLVGEPKYGPDFKHLDYVNPNAPKGGLLRMSAIGTFDSLNPYIIKGVSPAGMGLTYDSLMTSTQDDISSEYGLIAESYTVPDSLKWVEFTLRPEARWHDGKPITVEDVIFSFKTLRDKGAPFYRFYYANVAKVEKTGDRKVRFYFSGQPNRELPQIMGQLTVLPKHYWEGRDFAATTLKPPLSSGPYRVGEFEAGRYITYERVPDYWGKDLPINKGRYNFDTVRFDFYRDQTIALEAFKAHAYDFRAENESKKWATGYDFPGLKKGLAKKELVPESQPTGMQGFTFNLRREKFQDRKLREALSYAFDFEWSNKTLFYGQYTRTKSYFSNSELAATGLPSKAELALLDPYRDKLPPEVFNKVYEPPSTDGSGNIRPNLRKALKILRGAGWKVEGGKLRDPKTGEPLVIEFLLVSPAFERVVAPFIRNLKRLGVEGRIRIVDSAQYQNRIRDFDFDMIVGNWGESESPGNEQREFWGSAAADRPGSRNLIGIKSPVVDALIDKIIYAKDRKALVTATHALDRVLLWGFYVIPNWHIRFERIAYWDKFGRTDVTPKYGTDIWSWWVDPEREKNLEKGVADLQD